MRRKRRSKARMSKRLRERMRKRKSQRRRPQRNNTLTDVKVFAALSLARREHLSIEQAAEVEGTDVATIRKRAPSALKKHGKKYRVKPFDRIPAVMNILGAKGPVTVVVRSSKSRSVVGRYLNAVKTFLYQGSAEALSEFQNVTVAGQKLITNPAQLRQLANAGLVGIDRLYAGLTHGH